MASGNTNKKSIASRVADEINRENEKGARNTIIEELFNDYHRKKADIYWVNFTRGIFFGIGSVLGGSLLIAISALIFAQFVDLPGGIGDFIKSVLNAMNHRG